jgi:hypothetical protein
MENGVTLSRRFWRGVALLVRLDMAVSLALAAGLLFWLTWQS